MKRTILISILSIHAILSNAQILDQVAAEKKLQQQQLAALVVLSAEQRLGYQGVENGLSKIRGFTLSEHTLHLIYYASLAGINAKLYNYVQVHPPIRPHA